MIILAGFSFIVSNLGLTKLIQVSIPVLTAIYPPCIVLVALSFCIGLWHSATRILAPVMLVSLAFGVLDALKAAGLGQDFPQWLLHLPLAEQGLAWLIPSVATLAACSLVDRRSVARAVPGRRTPRQRARRMAQGGAEASACRERQRRSAVRMPGLCSRLRREP